MRPGTTGPVVTAMITVEDGLGLKVAVRMGHRQGPDRERGVQGRVQAPANDGAGREVEDDGQVEPAFVAPQVGHIPDRLRPGDRTRKAAMASGIEAVIGKGGRPRCRIPDGGPFPGAGAACLQALFGHEPMDQSGGAPDALLRQEGAHRTTANPSLGQGELRTNGLRHALSLPVVQ